MRLLLTSGQVALDHGPVMRCVEATRILCHFPEPSLICISVQRFRLFRSPPQSTGQCASSRFRVSNRAKAHESVVSELSDWFR